ncbi:aminoacylase-1A-like protein [Syncephalis plumigaleata]|nr:aminoacylase-1A-like protein [Syncephalis plumigaleata]
MTLSIEEANIIAVDNFRKYLRIRTVQPTPDYEGCAAFLKELAADVGFQYRRVEPVANKPILILTWEGTEPALPSIILNSHTDVVPVFPDQWTQDPFGAARVFQENGDYKIYARGAQDMKIVGISYVEALRRLKQIGWQPRRTLHLTFVPDEEIGGEDGMVAFIKSGGLAELNPGFCLDEGLANPEDAYKLYYAERVTWWIYVTAHGNTGHGSQFIKDTAAPKVVNFINAMLKYREEQESVMNSKGLRLGEVTSINLTSLKSGVQLNVVPEVAQAGFDIRITPTANLVEFRNWLDNLAKEHGVTCEYVQYRDHAGYSPLDEDNIWWRAVRDSCKKHNVNIDPDIFPAATDARFVRSTGVIAFGISPMRNTPVLLHDHDEFVYESGYLEGIVFYQNLLKDLAEVPAEDI